MPTPLATRPYMVIASALAVLTVALSIVGCRMKPRADLPDLPDERQSPISEAGLRAVFVSLHTGTIAKPYREPVVLRLRWRGQVIATEEIGREQRWEADTIRAVEFQLSPPIRMDAPGSLVLELSKPSVEGVAWPVRVEALGRLTDGGVLSLLDRTEPVTLSPRAEQFSWTVHQR